MPEEQRRPGQPWYALEASDYSPERSTVFDRLWFDLVAQVICGGCVTTTDHIAALRRVF